MPCGYNLNNFIKTTRVPMPPTMRLPSLNVMRSSSSFMFWLIRSSRCFISALVTSLSSIISRSASACTSACFSGTPAAFSLFAGIVEYQISVHCSFSLLQQRLSYMFPCIVHFYGFYRKLS